MNKCSFKVQVGEAYVTCAGDHSTEQHNEDDMAAFARGLAFAVSLAARQSECLTNGTVAGVEGTEAAAAAAQMLEVEKALRGVMEVTSPGSAGRFL